MDQTALAAAGIYAALNSFVLLWLAAATGVVRRRHKVMIGDGGVEHLRRVMRGHANATENVPAMLILLVVAAALGAPAVAIHALGAVFTLGRAIHAWHFIRATAPHWQRAVGFTLSAGTLAVTALAVLGHAVVLL